VGGVDIRHLYGQAVVIHGRYDLPGVLASLPSRMLPPQRRNKPYGFEDLVVDPGLNLEILKELVEIGDFISFQQPLRKLMGKNVTGKALDNRASVAAVTICLELLQGRKHEWDVVAVATAQEETRLLGAYTGTFSQAPDAAIAIDVTFAKGAGLNDQTHPELNSGPVLDIGPNIHPGIHKALKEAAEAIELSVSVETHSRGSGTDAFGIQVARSGVPTGLIAIPLRYMHTMVETINTKDVERTGRLLAEFIAQLDSQFLTDIALQMMDEGKQK
jgi:endoglucanase